MRRVHVHLDEQLDADLAREAARTGESKASLLRRAARAFLDERARRTGDGWTEFTGAVTDATPDDRHHSTFAVLEAAERPGRHDTGWYRRMVGDA